MNSPQKLLSRFRKLYQKRFAFRCIVLAVTVVLFFAAPGQFDVIYGFNCFRKFSVFDLLWLWWVLDMVMQLIPSAKFWPLGSQKFFKSTFRPNQNIPAALKENAQKLVEETLQPLKSHLERTNSGLLEFIIKSNRDTLKVGLVWFGLTAVIGVLYFTGVINGNVLMLLSVAFYVCDLICVLFWCPFRVWFMKNRCCTTCRIFNWDHIMMFSPIIFIPGFYTWTLCLAALIVFMVWEITFALHPERFWEGTNSALSCGNCTDQLCGQRNCRVDLGGISD